VKSEMCKPTFMGSTLTKRSHPPTFGIRLLNPYLSSHGVVPGFWLPVGWPRRTPLAGVM
jgi:hypothetical protein